jgi:hypothetical protein
MQHVRRQDWFAVFLDFIIVVIGVFVGIQVSNWNAARIDEARARGYLERIRADLDADIADYQNRLAFWGQVADYGRAGLAFADSGDPGGRSRWELLLAFFQASQVAEFFTTSATYEELKSAGELGLITDVTLRGDLARYYTYAGNPALTERPAYRMHVRGLIPLDVQIYIWDHCYASTSTGEQSFIACRAPIDERRASEIVESIRADADLMSELRYWMSTMKVASKIGSDRMDSAKQLRGAVEAAVGGAAAELR